MSKEHEVIQLFQEAQPFFMAVGDENRQQIITQLLQTRSLSVNEIAELTPLSRPAVSHHLKILRDSGLVRVEKQGTQRLYCIDDRAVAMLDQLDRLTTALRSCTNWKTSKK